MIKYLFLNSIFYSAFNFILLNDNLINISIIIFKVVDKFEQLLLGFEENGNNNNNNILTRSFIIYFKYYFKYNNNNNNNNNNNKESILYLL